MFCDLLLNVRQIISFQPRVSEDDDDKVRSAVDLPAATDEPTTLFGTF